MAIAAWLGKHQTLSAALLLVLVLDVCFFPFVWGNKTLLAGSRGITASIMPDGAWYGGREGPAISRGNDMGASAWLPEPDAALVHYQYLHEKALPLWNPYQSYGTPLAANMQSQPLNPLFLLYALGPGPRTYNLFILARLLLAGFGTYLYLRLFLSFAPSLAGSIACMLSGYYILFFNLPHLSVDVLVPALFWVTERLLRAQTTRNVVLLAAVSFWSIAGGMPESTFLALTFSTAYFLFRLATAVKRGGRLTPLKYFVLGQGLGLALAGILLVPFFEFMRLSFDSHQPINQHGLIPGLQHDAFGLSVFTYLAPLLFGLAWSPIGPGLGGYGSLRGYMGVVQILLAVVALGRLTKKRDASLFFFLSVAAVVLKRYGAPLLNWIGHLPFCQFVLFPKYEESLLAFAMAVLTAFGAHEVLAGAAARRRLAGSLAIVFVLLCAAMAFSLNPVREVKAQMNVFYLSLAGVGAILMAATLILLRLASRKWLMPALIALLTIEMAGNYIFPVYYVMSRSARDDANPYRGAPYIGYLKSAIGGHERIFGREGILHPSWAGSFQLADIRGLDAMYYRKYFDFVRFFTREEATQEKIGDLVNRFNGMRWLPVDTPLKKRMLQLSSVRFLLSRQPYGEASGRAREILQQNRERLAAGRENLIELRTFSINGDTKEVLYEHPAYERLPFRVTITPASRNFAFDVAMQPAVYDGAMPVCGAGVDFRLEIQDSEGQIHLLYDRYIDPKHNPAERRWIPASVSLSQYMGQTIELLFTTRPGPQGDTCAAWAGWGDPHFNGDPVAQPAFRQVYDGEVRIYECLEYLPRAALFYSVEVVPDDKTALARLGSPDFNVFQTAVVSRAALNAVDAAAIRSLNNGPPEHLHGARIITYSSQQAEIATQANRPSLLILNDSDYPGWKVYVDGQPSRWITANYWFRGVLLGPGKHTVRFAYEAASVATGGMISGAAFAGLAVFVALHKRRGRSRVAEAYFV